MPPKKSKKRKAPDAVDTNGHADATPPDRATYPGWIEMESEPAFFNVMLSDMRVEGIRVHEVLGLDQEMLAILPQPIHALIFLFRYRDVDEDQSGNTANCPDHVWFANQIPDFACATVALLNIVNNIKGLKMGKELRDFKHFTSDMSPIRRGDAIDAFDFVKRIHNSFARENDLLLADQAYRRKIDKVKKRQAMAKARQTREAKKENRTPAKSKSPKDTPVPQRSSNRRASKENCQLPSSMSSPLSDPPESDPEFATPSKGRNKPLDAGTNGKPRRSDRKPKPRQSSFAQSAAIQDDEDEDGFHFVAYIPIQGHVWRLDGLDKFPQDMGEFDGARGDDWMHIARSAIMTRIALAEGADIDFNLMAVVHDPILTDRAELAQNIKALQVVEHRLDKVLEDWRELDGGETKSDVLPGLSVKYNISAPDIESAAIPQNMLDELEKDDLMQLMEVRTKILREQAPLRGAVRDAINLVQEDHEKANHRRYDYGAFVRSWLGLLAEQGSISALLEGSEALGCDP